MPEISLTEASLQKEVQLKEILAGYGSMAIAYSGGVDSTYLAAVAHEVMGRQARVVIADSPSIPRQELQDAIDMAEERGWYLVVIETKEFEQEAFLKNDGTRCFFCKSELFQCMTKYAQENDIAVLSFGEIASDALDPTRLGAKAAKNYQVAAPLAEAGMDKADIRAMSKRRGLPTWNKASFACLSSRFPTGTRLEIEDVLRVERAEQLLRNLGFHQYRARHHDTLCRIEIEPDDFPKLIQPEVREALVAGLKKIGYRHITLDLAGYRTGSTADMPEELPE